MKKSLFRTAVSIAVLLLFTSCPDTSGVTLSSNALLSDLTISGAILTPSFSEETTAYTASVEYSVPTLTITATPADSSATVVYNPSQNPTLAVGDNDLSIYVTAADGSLSSYTITITRDSAGLSSDADLSTLALSSGTLTPDFSADTTSYAIDVDNSVTEITLTATASDDGATVTYDPAMPAALSIGDNVLTIDVAAEDGTTTKEYAVTVTRAAVSGLSSDKDITSVTFSGADIEGYMQFPLADDGELQIIGYYLPSGTTLSSLTPVITHEGASVSPASGTAQDFSEGYVEYTVTAEDGSTNTYIMVIDTEMPVLDADSAYVYMGGNFELYENALIDVTLSEEGESASLSEASLTIYDDYENANGKLLSSGYTHTAGEYDLAFEIDFDGDGSLTDDTGDAEATASYELPDTDLPVVFYIDLVDIPLLMSDSANEIITFIDFPSSTEDIIDITSSAPVYIELYEVGPDSLPPVPAFYTASIMAPADEAVALLLPAPGEDNIYLGYLYSDQDNSGDLSSGDYTLEFRYISDSESDSLVMDNSFEYYTNWMSRNVYDSTESNPFSAPGIDVDWAYEGNISIDTYDGEDDTDSGAFICNLVADSADPADWGNFNNTTNSHVRYFEIEAVGDSNADRSTIVGVPTGTDYYQVMLLDMDRSASLTDGDYYAVTEALQSQIVDYTDYQATLYVDDSDMTYYDESLNDGSLNVVLTGGNEYYDSADLNLYLTEVGAGVSSPLASASRNIDDDGYASQELLASGHGTAAGDYNLHVYIDFDGDGSYTNDSGDAQLVTTITLADSDTGSTETFDITEIPLLLSDSGDDCLALFDIVEADASDLVAISASAPLVVELYQMDPDDESVIITDILSGNVVDTYSFTSADDTLTLSLPSAGEDDAYLMLIYHDADNDGSPTIGDCTETISIFEFEDSLVIAETVYPYTTGMGQHSYPVDDRTALEYALDIEYEYTGDQDITDDDSGAWMCFVISDSSAVDDWSDFSDASNSNIRYYANMGDADNQRTLLGETNSASYYYIMVLDIDRSESLTSGDMYAVSDAITPISVTVDFTQSFSYGDGDMTTYP